MSNSEMEKPTEAQKNQLDALLNQLRSTAGRAEDISRTIGKLREQLNLANTLLSGLRGVIGPQAYRYPYNGRAEKWQEAIDEMCKQIEAALK